jgi:hypothetical protein
MLNFLIVLNEQGEGVVVFMVLMVMAGMLAVAVLKYSYMAARVYFSSGIFSSKKGSIYRSN